MKKVAIILSGCGVFDGAEITESVLTLLYVAKNGASYQCFAPNIDQMHTLNHLTGEEMMPNRNVLIESARIARGEIKDVAELNVEEFDALILPGGFGAAKNLSNFAVKGADSSVNSDVSIACKAFADANKPAGYVCIAPAMIPHIYPEQTQLTIGNDQDTASAINTLGGDHQTCPVEDIIIDTKRKVVSTPAYMLAGNILEADAGISKLVAAVLALCD